MNLCPSSYPKENIKKPSFKPPHSLTLVRPQKKELEEEENGGRGAVPTGAHDRRAGRAREQRPLLASRDFRNSQEKASIRVPPEA